MVIVMMVAAMAGVMIIEKIVALIGSLSRASMS